MSHLIRPTRCASLHLALLLALSLSVSCGPSPVFVHFDSGMEVPRPSSGRAAVNEAVSILRTHPALQAAVIGHTDDVGTAAVNKQLAFGRARRVRDMMTAQGIDAARIVVAARGELVPLANNATEEGRARNRRTEIFFFDPREGDLSAQYGVRLEIHAQ